MQGFFLRAMVLFYHLQFINDVFGTAKFVDAPQHVSNVHINRSVQFAVESNFMAKSFIIPIERQSN